jgi:16S rRNA (uracil1498-N3)-methyltransferase
MRKYFAPYLMINFYRKIAGMQLFYTTQIQGDQAILTDQELAHLKVLRKVVGDEVHFIDGKGFLYTGKVSSLSKKAAVISWHSREEKNKNRNYYLHVAIAPTKSMDRIEFFLEKAIEIGVDEISFFTSFHSERKVVKRERLEKIALSACKQSLKYHFPQINTEVKLNDLLTVGGYDVKAIAHCQNGEKMDVKTIAKNERMLILIGPEGDFSQEEIDNSIGSGLIGLDLGENRMRTETAGIFVCAAMASLKN